MIEYRTTKKEVSRPDPEIRKTVGRKDWGYTNHYRRMMMQRLPFKNEQEES